MNNISNIDNYIKPDNAIKFMEAIDPNRRWNLCALVNGKNGATMHSQTINNAKDVSYWLEQNKNNNCYFTLNETDVLKKPKEHEITKITGFYVDIDPQGEGDIYEERTEILSRLQNYNPAPSLIVDSGNGYQGIWLLKEPLEVHNYNREQDKGQWITLPQYVAAGKITIVDAKRINLGLINALGGDKVQNIDRLLRLPGSANIPNERKRSKGRTIVGSLWLNSNQDIIKKYSALELPIAPVLALNSHDIKITPIKAAAKVKVDELKQEYAHVPKECFETIINLKPLDYNDEPGRDNSRSAHLIRAIKQMLQGGIAEEKIKSILMDKDYRISENIYKQNRTPQRPPSEQADRMIGLCKGYIKNSLELTSTRAAADFTGVSMEEQPIASQPTDSDVDYLSTLEEQSRWLQELNEKYSVILSYHGNCLIMKMERDPLRGIEVFRRSVLRDMFANRLITEFKDFDQYDNIKRQSMPVAEWWFQHKKRRQYDSADFAPGKNLPAEIYNLFQGFEIKPKKGEFKLFQHHLWENICCEDKESYDYLIQWMAAVVQNLGTPGGNALILTGPKGGGKGTVAQIFQRILGRHFIQITNPEQTFGKFNQHLADKIFVFLDEAFWAAGSAKHEGALKSLITESNLVVEPKGYTAQTYRNCMNIMIASNNEFVVPATEDERRFFVLNISEKMSNLRKTDSKLVMDYFSNIYKEMDNGGAEAFLDYLLKIDLSNYNKYAPPKNAALQEQIELNLNAKELWLQEVLQNGSWFIDVDHFNESPCTLELNESFDEWKRRNNEKYERSRYFKPFFKKYIPEFSTSKERIEYMPREYKKDDAEKQVTISKAMNVFRFPSLSRCRELWIKKFPLSLDNFKEAEDDTINQPSSKLLTLREKLKQRKFIEDLNDE